MWPVAVTVVCLVAIGVGGFLYFTKLEIGASSSLSASGSATPAPASSPSPAKSVRRQLRARPHQRRRWRLHRRGIACCAPSAVAASASPAASVSLHVEKISWPARCRSSPTGLIDPGQRIRPAADHKALALNMNGIYRIGQRSAKRGSGKERGDRAMPKARRTVSRRGNARSTRSATGGLSARPAADAAAAVDQARSVDREAVRGQRICRWCAIPAKTRLENIYVPGRKNKSIALGPGGQFFSISTEKRSRKRYAERWKPAAPLPALPA